MACLFCRLIYDRLAPPENGQDAFWQYVYDWEEQFAKDWEPSHPNDEIRERVEIVHPLITSDPDASVAELAALAELGSAWAARQLGRYYQYGYAVDHDLKLAEYYYNKALHAGSWMGSLALAKMLFNHSISEEWKGILKAGDEAGFIPSTFWLVWYSYKRCPKRSTARELRPLLEKASQAGHPGARKLLARWKFTGKFGLLEIRQGLRETGQAYVQFVDREFPQREHARSATVEAA